MKLSFFKNSVEVVKYPSMLFDHFNDEVRGLLTRQIYSKCCQLDGAWAGANLDINTMEITLSL